MQLMLPRLKTRKFDMKKSHLQIIIQGGSSLSTNRLAELIQKLLQDKGFGEVRITGKDCPFGYDGFVAEEVAEIIKS